MLKGLKIGKRDLLKILGIFVGILGFVKIENMFLKIEPFWLSYSILLSFIGIIF